MIKRLAIVTVFLIAVGLVQATEFYLTDSKGKKSGPFQLRKGEIVSVEGKTFKISKAIIGQTGPKQLTLKQQTIQKMKNTIIPEIDFRDAGIHEVVAVLKKELEKNNKSDDLYINIMLNSQDTFRRRYKASPNPQPLITFKAKDISAYEAYNAIAAVSDINLVISGKGVVFKMHYSKQKPRAKE